MSGVPSKVRGYEWVGVPSKVRGYEWVGYLVR